MDTSYSVHNSKCTDRVEMTSCTNTGRKGYIRLEVCGRDMVRNHLDRKKKPNNNDKLYTTTTLGPVGQEMSSGVRWRGGGEIGV